MIDYDIHFYTAATRRYGEFCIEILKHELLRNGEKLKAQIEGTISKNRLITRDDKHKFSEGGSFAKSEAEMDNLRRAERIVLEKTGGNVSGDI